MAKLNITVEYDDLSTNTAFDRQQAVLSIANVVAIDKPITLDDIGVTVSTVDFSQKFNEFMQG